LAGFSDLGVLKQPLAGDYISLLVKTLFNNPDPPGAYAANPINPHYIIKQRGGSSMPDTPANPILRDPKQLKVTDSWHAYQQERVLHNMKEEYCAVLDTHTDIKYLSSQLFLTIVISDPTNCLNSQTDQARFILSLVTNPLQLSSRPNHQH
jgi:hypothetical protein